MKKNLTSLTKYADCSGKVMETGDHFKNGARPVKPTEQELNFNKQ
jgi:hypothetical protein